MILQRTEQNDFATYGSLRGDDGHEICVTLELPWRDNQHAISCIPAGEYTARRRWSPKHKADVFGIEGVPHRADIEIHAGNLPKDVLGCVVVGEKRGDVGGLPGIVNSRATLAALMQQWAGVTTFPFSVRDVPLRP